MAPLSLLLFTTILWTCFPAQAWEIQHFSSTIEVQSSGQLQVTETIEVDFSSEWRHGIYRDLPVDYLDRFGQRMRLRWKVLSVSDDRSVNLHYQLTRIGRYLRIRIGDPDTTVTGQKTYVIRYSFGRAINPFPDHDELYWNATGNEWGVPIQSARVLLRLPEKVPPNSIRAIAFTGAYGSRTQDAPVVIGENRTIACTTTYPLKPYEGLTVVVSWPLGILVHPSRFQRTLWWLADNWGYGIPFVVFLGMYWLWRRRGKEFPGRGSVVVQYDPPDGLSPAEIGTLIDDSVHLRDITASVIDLAVRGYLTIEPVGTTLLGQAKDYRLTRLKPNDQDSNLAGFEKIILKELFHSNTAHRETCLLSDLEMEFYEALPSIRKELYQKLQKQGYLDSQPDQVRWFYWGLAILVGFVGISGSVIISARTGNTLLTSWLIGTLLSAVIIAAFGYYMPRKTLKGRNTVDQIRGLEEFLSRADRDRIARMTEPQQLFERLLPYAMALGVANQWAALFEGLYTKPPDWYHGTFTAFSTRDFVGRLNHTTGAMASTFVSSPRTSASSGSSGFGGGGFSGGGFGGGGGGAW